MTKKIVSWLTFIAIFTLSIQSCIHDDIYTSSDPASADYHSKSLWKEDEKYIKNVMKIYSEHHDKIKKFSGTPDWDYAMSMGKYDESFMVVPVIENGKVVNTLACARFDKKVYFRYENSETNNAFFQNIIYGKYTRYKTEANNTKTNTHKGIVCITKTISMWYPDNESNPNAGGYWETNYYTNCYNFLDYSGPGWEDNGGGGYDYGCGGGSGGGNENSNQDITIDQLQNYPCAHSIAQQLPNLNNSIASNMRQIFQNNTKYNITFRAKSGLGTTDGETFATYSTEFDTFNAVINLNDEVLLNATKEYILVTMYHEVLHAFLKYQLYKLGNTEFQAQYPGVTVGYDYASNGTITNTFTFIEGHAQLVPFLTTLQNIVSQYNPNLPNNVITAISRAGITTLTPEQAQLNNNERNTLLGNNLGTKCP
ncbi:hypothetical protein [uncultured Chryseobacterium sp.]|uniref:hypothetical protein n=1 Tax=uncultured Chryseobacterium sp. TaxID=259322 RepID=UPI0025E76DEB|nr:hypothetical protein [uncultured Chryseobacterium sp.]